MKRISILLVGLSLALCGSERLALAQVGCAGDCSCDTECCGCDYCGCDGTGLFGEAELLLFKYHRADGVRVGDGDGEQVFGDYLTAPRFTVGYVGPGGLGARVRWFEWDQAQASNDNFGEFISVETQIFDLEVFERIALNNCWTIELSGGVRYNEFNEEMIDPVELRVNDFNGWGGIVGLEGVRTLGRIGSVYVRGRASIMNGDKFVLNSDGTGNLAAEEFVLLNDSTQGMTELAIGYQYDRRLGNGMLVRLRAGYEWQNWYNYSSAFVGPIDIVSASFDPASAESTFVGPSDVGFSGVAFSLAFER